MDRLRELADECGSDSDFGTLLRQIRTSKGHTQEMIAQKINRGTTWISDAENGKLPRATTISDIVILAKALNCHPVQEAQLIQAFICYYLQNLLG